MFSLSINGLKYSNVFTFCAALSLVKKKIKHKKRRVIAYFVCRPYMFIKTPKQDKINLYLLLFKVVCVYMSTLVNCELSTDWWVHPWAGAYLGPKWVYALKGLHGTVVCIKYMPGDQCIRALGLTFFKIEVIEIVKYKPVSRAKRASKKNQQFGISEHYLYLFHAYLYDSSVHVLT